MLRLPRILHMEVHKVLCLPRKMCVISVCMVFVCVCGLCVRDLGVCVSVCVISVCVVSVCVAEAEAGGGGRRKRDET